jgi:hypothetical protein
MTVQQYDVFVLPLFWEIGCGNSHLEMANETVNFYARSQNCEKRLLSQSYLSA